MKGLVYKETEVLCRRESETEILCCQNDHNNKKDYQLQ